MKKWVCLILAVLVAASATVVMAEESADDLPPSGLETIASPEIPYGEKLPEAMEKIESSYSYSLIQFSGTPVQSTRTLSNGKQYQEITMSGSAPDDSYQLEAKFYFTNDGMTIAGTQEYTFTDAIDLSNAGLMLDTSLGAPMALDLEAHGDYAELLGEAAHLENGQNVWHYTAEYYVTGEDGFIAESIPITVYVAMRIVDHQMYMAEFMEPNVPVSTEAAAEAPDVKGFDQLTPEEQKAVSLFAEYLEASKQTQLEQYVAFLLNRH